MKKRTNDLRPEYNLAALAKPVRGKYYKRASAGTNLVLIEPDVASVFPDGEAVNEALRDLINLAEARAGKGKGNGRSRHRRKRSRKPQSQFAGKS